ncbi:MAG: hypothetical protein ACI8S6_004521 [Myxococcota bacterium]|jgi:hypothetical protein
MPFMLALPMLLACQPEPKEDNKVVVISGGGHSASSAEDFEALRFPCCDNTAVADTIAAYVDLNDALAADDLPRSQAAAAGLAARAARAAEAADLSEADHQRAATLAALAGGWAAAGDLKAIRSELTQAAAVALPLAREHRGGELLSVVVAFCPMAPGRWLQSRPQLLNPYFGAEMLTCGVFEE